MFRHYFKIAWRNLLKDRQFTFLNLIGLSTGLAFTFLIYLWVTDELNVDRFNAKDSQLFQVMANTKNAGGIVTIPQTPTLLANALSDEMPEVENAAAAIPAAWGGKITLSVKDNNINAIGQFAGKDYFNIFSYHLIQGDRNGALSNKNSIVLSKELAMKLFNTTENIVGKPVTWEHDKQYKVSGIFEGTPSNSSVQADFFAPIDVFLDDNPYEKDWGNSDPNTYVILKKGTDINQLNHKIAGFVKTKIKESNTTLFVRPFSKGYLYGRYENGVQSGGRIEYVRLFSIIAIFILVIACINFMNLSTAKASKRVKEVGIKKVVGATRQALIFQYLGESLLMTFLSLLIAMLLVAFLLPAFNEITGKHLLFRFDARPVFFILSISLLTGLISGSYPALYLSGFKPATVLKGKLRTSAGELWVRKGLVVFQFSISVVFIVSVLIVYKQLVFIEAKNPGYNKDNLISINMKGSVLEKIIKSTETFVSEGKNIPGIVNISSMDHSSIIGDYGSTGDINWEGKNPRDIISFGNIGVNYEMIETLGIELAAGRSFSRRLSSDSSEIIFNEAAINAMGLKNPIGKTVSMWGKDRKIVGVVKNFHFESLHEMVKPFAIRLEPLFTNIIIAKIKPGTEKSTIEKLQQLYQKYSPGFPFDYKFLDEDYQGQYVAERRVASLSRWFAGLAILISCLGLFGLAAFTAERRFKEIGIRKVLGASVTGIAVLFSKDFLKLILIAVFIAFPLAWWASSQWLNGFAYRIPIGAGTFLIAGGSTLLITLLTISFQAVKAALANPVKSLKTE
jgi:ABC-type antimicrobial peptide transport system permease subunit